MFVVVTEKMKTAKTKGEFGERVSVSGIVSWERRAKGENNRRALHAEEQIRSRFD